MTNDIYTEFENFLDFQNKLNNYTTRTVKTNSFQMKAGQAWIIESGVIDKLEPFRQELTKEVKYAWNIKSILEAYYPNGLKGFLKTYAQMRATEVFRLKTEENYNFNDIASHLEIPLHQAQKLYNNALSMNA